MITLSQIKAARALLGWTQEQLAAASGLSLPSINNLERGISSPRATTHAAIVSALEKAGIEFTDQNGLRLREEEKDIRRLKGAGFLQDLDSDILSVLKSEADEILAFSCDERKWMELGALSNPIYVQARGERKWRERILVPDTCRFMASPPSAYRRLDADGFGRMSYEIYGDRLALIDWQSREVTLIRHLSTVDMFRRQFEVLWKQGKPFSRSEITKIERLDLQNLA